MTEAGIPCVALGLIHGPLEFAQTFRHVAPDLPPKASEGNIFQVGSITKTFVALAVMRLAETGRLSLDSPLEHHFEWPGQNISPVGKITIRHLLTHSSGLPDVGSGDLSYSEQALTLLSKKIIDFPLLAPPGTAWSYSNAGYCLLGRIIEITTGMAFEDAMTDLVFEPLGLSSSFVLSASRPSAEYVSGHCRNAKALESANPWAMDRAMNPAGGILSDLENLLVYARFQMTDGLSVVSTDTLHLMRKPHISSTGLWQMGLGWNVMDLGDTRMIGHGGVTPGQVTLLRIIPEHRFAVAVLANAEHAGRLCMETANLAIREFLDLEVPEPRGNAMPPPRASGTYGPYDLKNIEAGLALKLPNGESSTLAFHAADSFTLTSSSLQGATGEFVRDADGTIGWLRMIGRLHPRSLD